MVGRELRPVMLGGGDYDRHSTLQAGVLAVAASRLERAVRAVAGSAAGAVPRAAPVCLADYGSATGRNAILALSRAAALLAEHAPGAPLALCFCDQPGNDWRALASNLHEALGSRPELSFAMLPRSFYGPVLPPCSVDLAWSALAVHWLSEVPAASIDHLWPHGRLGAARAPFSERARLDWSVFVAERARELRAGGQLVVMAACAQAGGISTADGYLDVVGEVLGELERAGELSAGERAALHVPTYFRSAEEWTAPFGDGAPLELCSYEEEPLPDALWEAFERSGDRRAYAAAWVGWLRAFSAPLLAAALEPSRSAEQRAALLDALYRRVAERVASEPERARIPWTVAVLHAAKR